ncbi:GGDEF domain-containing protein [Marinobacter lacisalsi]|uniref:diguanylate cyclase n=1 Tax=Marinobacter lacisalsi TaxID=475979 RepID=A0ABV8QE85_9GAMM
MLNVLRRLWGQGAGNQTATIRRQIELANQVALFGAIATIPYQFFYAIADFSLYLSVFLANMICITGYIVVVLFNRMGRYWLASVLLLVNATLQIFVVTSEISTSAGVHFFYFTMASVAVFLFHRARLSIYIGLMVLLMFLFLVTYFLFPAGSTPAPVPAPWIHIMFGVSVVASMALSAVVLFLFRHSIDQTQHELLLTNQRLERLSGTDQLTGLANRRELDDVLEVAWTNVARYRMPLTVLMCDVDYFKRFNDRFGHADGDRCLKQVADALQQVCGRPGDVVARYGGEEFVIVLPGTDRAGAVTIGEQARKAVEALRIAHPDSPAGVITLSLGSATSDRGHNTVTELLDAADRALYRAKEAGRNAVVFASA